MVGKAEKQVALNEGVRMTAAAPSADATSQLAVVDAAGNAISMTTTNNLNFGSRLLVQGYILNNAMTNFADAPKPGEVSPNKMEAGKRPVTSMAPTMVFNATTGALEAVVGSPGGSAIIQYVTKTLLGLVDWRLDIQQAIDLPNFGSVGGPVVLEDKRFAPPTLAALRARGAEVREQALTSGLQAIVRKTDNGKATWISGADPRREGVVLGE